MAGLHAIMISMEGDLGLRKKALRRQMRGLSGGLSPRELREKSQALCQVLAGTEVFQAAPLVAGFYPLPEEPDILPLLERVLARGQSLALPRVEGENLVFRRLTRLEDCVPGYRGIREPGTELPPLGTEELAAQGTLILVPGLAFDSRGGRLGRGKGFYDRLLRSLSLCGGRGGAGVVGVFFGFQLVNQAPMGPDDCPVGYLLSDGGFRRAGPLG